MKKVLNLRLFLSTHAIILENRFILLHVFVHFTGERISDQITESHTVNRFLSWVLKGILHPLPKSMFSALPQNCHHLVENDMHLVVNPTKVPMKIMFEFLEQAFHMGDEGCRIHREKAISM